MKFISFFQASGGVATAGAARPGLLLPGERVLPLPYPSLLALIQAGEPALAQVRALAAAPGPTLALADVRLAAPIQPPTLRDFYAFEQHVRTANANRGRSVPEEWYQFPVFYFTNPSSIYGPEARIPYPHYTAALDYELEIACVIGKPGINLRPEQAEAYIFGYTIFNDWSARDVQRQEMKVGLGPAKGKDFASGLGPCIVTIDELQPHATGRPGVFDLEMRARLNGVERSHGNFKDIHYTFGELLARASDSVWLFPGDVIGSGTVGSGCLLELTRAQGPWLQAGDVVELEIEALGVLRATVGEKGNER